MSAGMGGAQGRPGEPLPTFGASPLLDSSPAVAAGLTAAGWVRTDVTHNYQGKGIRSKIFSAWWRRVPLPDIGGDSPRVWSLPSLQAMRTDLDGEPLRDATVVAFDTEFCYDDRAGRLVLSYQFAFVDPADPSRVVEVMVAPLPDAGSPGGARRVPLGQILSWMVAAFQINWDGWSYHGGPHYYDKVPRHKDGSRDYRTRDKDPIDVVLVGHYLPADITALEMGRDQPDLLVRLSSVQGGLVSLPGGKGRPRSTDYIHPAYLENTRKFWSVRVTFRDTMAQSPAGKKSLAALGDAVGVPKLELSEDARLAVARDVELDFQSVGLDDAERAALAATFELDADDADVADDAVKERMDRLLVLRPAEFAEYAAQDALVVLSYELAVWGSGQGGRGVVPPPTLTSAATRVAKRLMGRYLCVPVGRRSGDLFDQVYRGLRRVRDKEKPAPGGPPVPSGSPAPYIQDTTLRPLDGWCEEAQAYAIHAYHGGINSCDGVTLHQGHRTWDWDLQNAYPTAMNVVPDVWWNHPQGPIECRLVDVDLDWSFFDKHLGPMTPLYAYVTFDFPRDVKWPCLPLTEGSSLVFPRTSKGADARDAAWACAPELWVALAMGARVHVLKGVVLRHRPRGPIARGGYDRCLSAAVTQLVEDRSQAKALCGKKSLPELLLKTMVNSLYGKTAQDVSAKDTWNAWTDTSENLGGSAITSPHHAAMTTSLVRAELCATMEQLHRLGYGCYSVTTDGFITDAPADVLVGCDMFGLLPLMQGSRMELSGDPAVWAVKHEQDDLLSFTTRGNVSLDEGGVCAHNSLRYPAAPDGWSDRACLYADVVYRTRRVRNDVNRFPCFRRLAARGLARQDFETHEAARWVSCDYDLKRKPEASTLASVDVRMDPDAREEAGLLLGEVFPETTEVATFETVPFEDVAEYGAWRTSAETMRKAGRCLRTRSDWEDLFWRVAHAGTRKPRDMTRARLMTALIGYRQGDWSSPVLDALKTPQAKLDWLNAQARGPGPTRPLTMGDWKNARRPERRSQMLPERDVSGLLKRMNP